MAKARAVRPPARPPIKISTGIDLGHLETRIQEAIARRAYDLFEKRGRQHGSDLADWFRAEAEIQRPANAAIREADHGVEVKVQAPGFAAAEIEVGVSHHRVVIWGLKVNAGKEFGAFLADIRLPSPVNPAKSTATLEGDQVEVQLNEGS